MINLNFLLFSDTISSTEKYGTKDGSEKFNIDYCSDQTAKITNIIFYCDNYLEGIRISDSNRNEYYFGQKFKYIPFNTLSIDTTMYRISEISVRAGWVIDSITLKLVDRNSGEVIEPAKCGGDGGEVFKSIIMNASFDIIHKININYNRDNKYSIYNGIKVIWVV